ncbi:MAG: hypothetical protein ABJA02_04805, partial [Acidobacteriota bacterium]
MKKFTTEMVFTGVVIGLFAIWGSAQSGGTFQIEKSVIAGGGGNSVGGAFAVDGTIGQTVAGMTSTGGAFSLAGGFWGGTASAAPIARTKFDYDGDGKTDESVFRPSDNVWYLNRSQAGFAGYQFGAAGDV